MEAKKIEPRPNGDLSARYDEKLKEYKRCWKIVIDEIKIGHIFVNATERLSKFTTIESLRLYELFNHYEKYSRICRTTEGVVKVKRRSYHTLTSS